MAFGGKVFVIGVGKAEQNVGLLCLYCNVRADC